MSTYLKKSMIVFSVLWLSLFLCAAVSGADDVLMAQKEKAKKIKLIIMDLGNDAENQLLTPRRGDPFIAARGPFYRGAGTLLFYPGLSGLIRG